MPSTRRRPPHAALAVVLLGAAPVLYAQAPDDALAAAMPTVCAGAAGGSELAARCDELSAAGPGAIGAASAGNRLGEIPGQGRAATRDGAPDDALLETGLAAGWSLFFGADTGRQKRRGGDNEAPFDGDSGSLTAGIDWTPAADWSFGLLLTHARDELQFLDSDGVLRTRFTGPMAVGGWLPGEAWSVDAYLGRLNGRYDIRRDVAYVLPNGVGVAGRADAAADADRDLAGVGTTWSHARGAWEWQLSAGVDWQRTGIDPYIEDGGAGFAIAVPAREVVSRRGRFDATLARSLSASWGVWQPLASVGWRHEFANPARPITVAFVQDTTGTPVLFDTDDPDAGWGEASLGAAFVFSGGHSAFVEYRQRFAHDFLDERILALGWRIEMP